MMIIDPPNGFDRDEWQKFREEMLRHPDEPEAQRMVEIADDVLKRIDAGLMPDLIVR